MLKIYENYIFCAGIFFDSIKLGGYTYDIQDKTLHNKILSDLDIFVPEDADLKFETVFGYVLKHGSDVDRDRITSTLRDIAQRHLRKGYHLQNVINILRNYSNVYLYVQDYFYIIEDIFFDAYPKELFDGIKVATDIDVLLSVYMNTEDIYLRSLVYSVCKNESFSTSNISAELKTKYKEKIIDKFLIIGQLGGWCNEIYYELYCWDAIIPEIYKLILNAKICTLVDLNIFDKDITINKLLETLNNTDIHFRYRIDDDMLYLNIEYVDDFKYTDNIVSDTPILTFLFPKKTPDKIYGSCLCIASPTEDLYTSTPRSIRAYIGRELTTYNNYYSSNAINTLFVQDELKNMYTSIFQYLYNNNLAIFKKDEISLSLCASNPRVVCDISFLCDDILECDLVNTFLKNIYDVENLSSIVSYSDPFDSYIYMHSNLNILIHRDFQYIQSSVAHKKLTDDNIRIRARGINDTSLFEKYIQAEANIIKTRLGYRYIGDIINKYIQSDTEGKNISSDSKLIVTVSSSLCFPSSSYREHIIDLSTALFSILYDRTNLTTEWIELRHKQSLFETTCRIHHERKEELADLSLSLIVFFLTIASTVSAIFQIINYLVFTDKSVNKLATQASFIICLGSWLLSTVIVFIKKHKKQ